jgi:DNA-binding beta-propeller fold protein YncE
MAITLRRLPVRARQACRGAHPTGIATGVLALILAACAAPGQPTSGAPPALYVANSRDGTISRLDGVTGRPLGPALPAGAAPWQIAPGPDGSLLVASGLLPRTGELTLVARSWRGWTTRVVPLGATPRDAALAGDGGRYAVVAYHVPDDGLAAPPGHCRLALVDALAGRVERTHALCVGREWLAALAFENGSATPVAFLGVRDAARDIVAGRSIGRDRIVAVDAAGGTLLAALALAGPPSSLTLAPAPGKVGARLYCVESLSGAEYEPGMPFRGRLLGLNPETLEVETVRPLGFKPARLAVAPDGDRAYALHEHAVMRLDLAGGGDALLTNLPEPGAGLAVTHDRVYVSDFYGGQLWALDRHPEGRVTAIPVGRHPTAIMLGPFGAPGRAR